MKKKDATSLYMSLKGAFISAHADFSEMEEADGPPKPYGNVKYADPKNGKYPIDTPEHARAAWSYINVPKNASEYSPDELKTIKGRIKTAAKKFGIQISAESTDSDTNILDSDDLTPEENLMAKAHEESTEDILALTEELSEDLSKMSDNENSDANEAVGDGDDSGDADLSPEDSNPKNHDFTDKNGDGNCDVCGATAAQHADASLNPAGKTTEAVGDGDDAGDADLSPETTDVKNHDFIDNNGDGNCDVCGATAAQHADASLSPAGKEAEERPEGQEKVHDTDVDSETSDGAPKSREAEEAEGEVEEGETEEQANEAELNGTTVEPQVEELTAKVETLEQENGRLKKALHRVLAERVVDAKITVGAVKAEDRNTSVEEHASRTSSSLADALRDFAKLPKVNRTPDLSELQMDEKSEVVGEEKDTITIGVQEDSEPVNPLKVAEDTFVDAFMGRSRL